MQNDTTFFYFGGKSPSKIFINDFFNAPLMGKGIGLSEAEKAVILLLDKQKSTVSAISLETGRSRCVITNFLSDTTNYGVKKSSGRPKKLSLRIRSKIVCLAAGKNITANKIKAQLDVQVHKSTILRVISDDGKLKRRKVKRKPILSKLHKTNRLIFSGKYSDLDEEWGNVIFSDEKRFNLDGPDGYNYYWAGLNSEEIVYPKRANGGPSLMVWGCFNLKDKSELAFIKGNIDSEKYQGVLESHLIPFIKRQNNPNVIFQQDNARPHVSKSTKDWFSLREIELLYWPAFSPDLNPIENLWGELSRMVYANGRVYNSLNELQTAIMCNWFEIKQTLCEKLINSMSSRIQNVVANGGGSTKY